MPKEYRTIQEVAGPLMLVKGVELSLIHICKESAGIPEEILLENQENCVRIPMIGGIRSLNLGNSVAVILYEALRQNGFAGMNLEGNLHRLEWK